jgi:15-cis-phytoene synthase / lycopene beta-cyclase
MGGTFSYFARVRMFHLLAFDHGNDLFERSLSGGHLRALPLHVTCGSIIVPTVYLWFVDAMALRDGTWIIAKGTKIDWQLWGALDIE